MVSIGGWRRRKLIHHHYGEWNDIHATPFLSEIFRSLRYTMKSKNANSLFDVKRDVMLYNKMPFSVPKLVENYNITTI